MIKLQFRWFAAIAALTITSALPAQQRDVNSALTIAQQFVAQKNHASAKSSLNNGSADIRLVSTSKVNAYYVFNQEGTGNYVMVSGDERMPEVLGYFDVSSGATSDLVDFSNLPCNVACWFAHYDNIYLNLQNTSSSKVYKVSSDMEEVVSPILKSSWGQDFPFYNNCPMYLGQHCATGCVSTAMSQIMYSFKHPECGNGTISYNTESHGLSISENLSDHPFDWDNMIDSYNGTSTTEQQEAVANLCYMTGISVTMDYSTDGSSALNSSAMTALANNFGYDTDMAIYNASSMTEDTWNKLLQSQLKEGQPLLYSGVTTENVGHAFVLDGYSMKGDIPYYHINWGWNGSYDGSFALGNFKTGSDNFTESQSFIGNIKVEDNVKTLNSHWEGTMTLSSIKMKKSETKKVTVTLKAFNYALRDFTGKIRIDVEKPDGSVSTLYTANASDVAFNYGFSIPTSFTPDSGEGIYTLKAYSTASGSSTTEEIGIGGNYTVEVVSDDQGLETKETNLQATAMTIDESKTEGTTVSVSLNKVINFSSETFYGTVKLAIADTLGNKLNVFGEGKSISELKHYYSLNNPIVLTATIPTSLSDGQYRLYAASCMSGYDGWTYLRKWVYSGGYIKGQDDLLYCDIWIKDGSVYTSAPDKKDTQVNLVINIEGSGSVTVDSLGSAIEKSNTFTVDYSSTPLLTFKPSSDKQLTSVCIDGIEMITSISDLTYRLSKLTKDATVSVTFLDAIDFDKTLDFYYDETASTITKRSDGSYASGSKIVAKLANKSGVEIQETSIQLSDGLDGAKNGNLLSQIYTLPNNNIRTWTITLGHDMKDPVIYETIRVRGQEYIKVASINPIEKEIAGDVNGDASVDISDVNAVISVICSSSDGDSKTDVNGDGTVDISDVNAIISIICGG